MQGLIFTQMRHAIVNTLTRLIYLRSCRDRVHKTGNFKPNAFNYPFAHEIHNYTKSWLQITNICLKLIQFLNENQAYNLNLFYFHKSFYIRIMKL